MSEETVFPVRENDEAAARAAYDRKDEGFVITPEPGDVTLCREFRASARFV